MTFHRTDRHARLTKKTEGVNLLTDKDIESFRSRLLDEVEALNAEDAASAEDRGTVHLDQQSVGRLSRMDALQRQAMAEATMRRRAGRVARIEAALARIEEDAFGFCQDCGEDIPAARLELDPSTPLCLSCAKG